MSDRQTTRAAIAAGPRFRRPESDAAHRQKIPYATGSLSAGIGAVGGLPYANTQFNFAEVGVNVDITPTVHGKDEVTLKMMIEVSNVSDHVSIGGIDQPVISTAAQRN